ncbi:unnamed protein product [Nippostrongylus brasiliensis]|uniref:Secreted protein n=1 Tax=Nippostrongylus brasiliensis TaxID=27835 RepID=A0A0N4XVT3_NIPBR|nr:unnamed protein product [Nippostrongylus brasiliensis]
MCVWHEAAVKCTFTLAGREMIAIRLFAATAAAVAAAARGTKIASGVLSGLNNAKHHATYFSEINSCVKQP